MPPLFVMPRHPAKTRPSPPASIKAASEVLSDYEQWLLSHYGAVGTYAAHAKSFLKRFRDRGSLVNQLDTFAARKSITGRSILNRFKKFLVEKSISSITNDLRKDTALARLPRTNAVVKLFMATSTDRLKSPRTLSTYATILNGYFNFIREIRHFEKITAECFVFQKNFSPFTTSLYASVLKAFAKWALAYVTTPNEELSAQERKIKSAFSQVSVKALRDVAQIKAKRGGSKLYYKESFSKKQRTNFLTHCKGSEHKAIISLMAYNGLRPIEVERLGVSDVDFRSRTIAIWGKGREARAKENIVLFDIVARHIRSHLKGSGIKRGKLFPRLSYKKMSELFEGLAGQMRLVKPVDQATRYSLHSLRHTCGQLLYDEGVPLEFIQRTLRHTSMQSTLIYARKAIEKSYFKQMRHLW